MEMLVCKLLSMFVIVIIMHNMSVYAERILNTDPFLFAYISYCCSQYATRKTVQAAVLLYCHACKPAFNFI